jgi:hypothetical protein
MLKMKNTKTRSFAMMLCLLVMTLVMYNCKKDEEPLPDKPDQGKVDDLNKIEIAPVTITPPAAVATTEATVEVSAKATEVNGALGGIAASGTVPASVSAAAAEVTAAVPAADMATLSAVTPAQIAAVKAGGAIPADVKAALDKAAANPAIQAYLPKFTLPTVGGETISGRVAAPAGVAATADVATADAIEAVQEASDVCIAAADGVFNTKKSQLDAAKATNDAAATTAYNTAVAAVPAAGACTDPLAAKYAAFRGAVDAQVNQAMADVDAAQAVLGDLYPVLKTLINIQALNAYSGLNNLQAADTAACTAANTQRLAAATAARDANLAASQSAYASALDAANVARTALIQSCHNQGGGN